MWLMLEFLQILEKEFHNKVKCWHRASNTNINSNTTTFNDYIASTTFSIGRIVIKSYYNDVRSWNKCWGHNTSNDEKISGWLI